MRLDDVDDRGWLPAGLRWVAAGVLALSVHTGTVAVVIERSSGAPLATGGEPAVVVDLEPIEGEKALDEMLPAEASGDPSTAASPALNSAASAGSPTPTSGSAAPHPPPQPPDTERVSPAMPSVEPMTPRPPDPPKVSSAASPSPEPVKAEPQVSKTVRVPPRSSAPSTASAAAEEAAAVVRRLSAGQDIAWRGQLVAHFNKFRRFPPGTGTGTARIGFTVDTDGRVVVMDVVSSSGNATLDAAALALVRRANPFPPPPPNISGKSLSFVVPIHFERRQP